MSLVFSSEMETQLQAAGGLLKVGLYAPRQGVADIAGRFEQAAEKVQPRIHLKANFFASGTAWEKLMTRPEMAGVVRGHLCYLADLSPGEREELIYYFTVGSTNMDYRSMVMDGEVMVVVSGWQSLYGFMDFLLLPGLCEWVETTAELDALLPPPSGLTRAVAGTSKLAQ